jgi:hypothetical protein
MKMFRKVCVAFGLALASTIPAPAVQVTFQINMSAQTALGNFDPVNDGVVVAGDTVNNWSYTASPLASSPSDTNIWEGTYDVPGAAGSTNQYKFVMITGSGVVWEGTVGTGGTQGNRTFILADTNQVLPVVYFNNVTNSTSVTNAITFQLNMSIQIAQGNFDPASGTVNIAGEFNNWTAGANVLTNSPADTNLWVTTIVLSGAVGAPVNYKYIMNGTWENNNVGPGGAQNRTLNLARTNQTLPQVYFNNASTLPVPTPLVFQVNMAAQTALGNFSPDTDMVEARGTFNGWSAGFGLTNSPANPYLFSGTWVDTADTVGAMVQYQFVISGTTWETGVGNRTYTLVSTNEQTLPLVFFNNVSNLGPIAMHPGAGGQATLVWTAGPLIRLQAAGGLVNSSWQDVPNTQGSNSVTVPLGPGTKFFRLIGP